MPVYVALTGDLDMSVGIQGGVQEKPGFSQSDLKGALARKKTKNPQCTGYETSLKAESETCLSKGSLLNTALQFRP